MLFLVDAGRLGKMIAVYWICMIYRFIFFASVVLLSFPFVGVYLQWKVWIAFGLGVLFFVYSVYSVVRHVADRREDSSEERVEHSKAQE